MTERPRALDLFCGAGGASAGLVLAGFDVTGVDLHPQPEYPYRFIQHDALALPLDFLRDFRLIWASPPCQFATAYKRRPAHVAPVANLIPPTRARLAEAHARAAFGRLPMVTIIENVEGARAHMRDPVLLCGSMWGLDVRRHRLFETSFELGQLPCSHPDNPRFAPATNRTNKRSTVEIGVYRIPLAVQRAAMGIDWMSLKALSQAIPPVYARHLAVVAKERLGL